MISYPLNTQLLQVRCSDACYDLNAKRCFIPSTSGRKQKNTFSLEFMLDFSIGAAMGVAIGHTHTPETPPPSQNDNDLGFGIHKCVCM